MRKIRRSDFVWTANACLMAAMRALSRCPILRRRSCTVEACGCRCGDANAPSEAAPLLLVWGQFRPHLYVCGAVVLRFHPTDDKVWLLLMLALQCNRVLDRKANVCVKPVSIKDCVAIHHREQVPMLVVIDDSNAGGIIFCKTDCCVTTGPVHVEYNWIIGAHKMQICLDERLHLFKPYLAFLNAKTSIPLLLRMAHCIRNVRILVMFCINLIR
mmetsp:Transcript_46071/g.88747  ORF Transcript_46071/g.88747 Transcript_46071/m.88747 type:complete len:214 (-) Transcript_46071:126-767(-)